MKAADLFVKCLEEEGIEYIFGVPGEENADFMLSLEKSGKMCFCESINRFPSPRDASEPIQPYTHRAAGPDL